MNGEMMSKTHKPWKQPISTEILNPKFNALDRAVWSEIMLRARNESEFIPVFYHGNKQINLFLKRGSMVFRVSQFARELGVDRRKVRLSIDKLKKAYNEMYIETKGYGLIIQIKNYNELVSMGDSVQRNVHRTDNGLTTKRTTSNKSVKTVKNVKKASKKKFLLGKFVDVVYRHRAVGKTPKDPTAYKKSLHRQLKPELKRLQELLVKIREGEELQRSENPNDWDKGTRLMSVAQRKLESEFEPDKVKFAQKHLKRKPSLQKSTRSTQDQELVKLSLENLVGGMP